MLQNLLFSDLPIEPDPSLGEPVVWIQRLVLLESLNAQEPIRDIPFRRGLNIIATERATEADEKPVGHDVGKTMLVRIIRYLLGEDHYCDEAVRAAVTEKLPQSYAMGQFRVAGETWCVTRPLGLDSGASCSWCQQTDDLDSVRSSEGQKKYSAFVAALNDATSACYANVGLPHADKRLAEWKDLLGWLSRDQDCLFNHHAEWRVTESQAGPRVLKREDAHLVMRMALGLLRQAEIDGMRELDRLRDKQAQSKTAHERLDAFLEQTERDMRQWLAGRDVDVENIPDWGLFGPAVVQRAEDRIGSFKRLLDDVMNRQDVRQLQDAFEKAAGKYGAIQRRVDDLTAQRDVLRKTVEDLRKQDDDSFRAMLADSAWVCKFWPNSQEQAMDAGCPGKDMAEKPSADMSQWRESQIGKLEQDIAGMEQALAGLRDEFEVAQGDVEAKRTAFREKLAEQVKSRDGIASEIGQWDQVKQLAETHRTRFQECEHAGSQVEARERDIRKCRDGLASLRAAIADDLAKLSSCYTAVLREIVSPEAKGEIIIDGNGIRPKMSNQSSSGTTLRTCARVLAFDMGCLTAAICGVGHLPRLWMHDSPRAADTEEPLYQRLLSAAGQLEAIFGDGEPTFQHIWTTTSSPPSHLDDEPYVRLRLHGRQPEGKLFRRDME